MLIALVAGETSGDLLGAELLRALRERRPDLQFAGIGGPQMASAGCVLWHDAEELAVRGYAEVIRHLPRLVRLRRRLIARLIELRPALFIGIDAPDFNLRIEQALRQKGLRTMHYVSPSLWAWRGERLAQIREAVDRMLVLFPFETEIYREAKVPVSYVGHPLADIAPIDPDRTAEKVALKLDRYRPVFALLPGSRQSELEHHAALFIDTAREVARTLPEAQFLVPLATRETRDFFEAALYRAGPEAPAISLLYGHAGKALAAADVALVASGTATLEAALYRCPQVVTYRLSAWTYRLVKRKLRLPYVSLPNVMAGRFVVPEILQDAATAENLAQALCNLHGDKVLRERLERHCAELHQSLRQNSAARAASAVLEMLPA
ncbi:MAG: lipid-A-disaccharide synthase [Burkholderiales bacterium]|nr:MAG: lipid-A-disaccharide synthase [Burkholderiales bacterium]